MPPWNSPLILKDAADTLSICSERDLRAVVSDRVTEYTPMTFSIIRYVFCLLTSPNQEKDFFKVIKEKMKQIYNRSGRNISPHCDLEYFVVWDINKIASKAITDQLGNPSSRVRLLCCLFSRDHVKGSALCWFILRLTSRPRILQPGPNSVCSSNVHHTFDLTY